MKQAFAQQGTPPQLTLQQCVDLGCALNQHAIMSIADAAGKITFVNDKFCQVSRYRRDELLGQNHRVLKSGKHSDRFYDEMWQAISSGNTWQGVVCNRAKDGSFYWVESSIVPFLDDNGLPYQYISLRTDISRLKQAELALITAKNDAEHASRAKSQFLSSMSHELRTPMNAILGFSQLLEYDGTLSEDQLGSVQEILKAGNHLLDLIGDVLNLARIESGNIELSIEPVNYTEVLDECLSLIRPLADVRGIRIDTLSSESVTLRADRMRLKQVLINLISNAVKYNRPSGSITLRIAPASDGQVRIMVSDSGQGIPAARMEELFQPFNRLGEENSSIAGTGIGLSISRQLVELMGGSIGAESEAGVGSSFWVELPSECALHAGQASREEGGMEHFTILYVDDTPSNLKHMSKLLARHQGIHLITAHTPAIGLELANEKRPDLIVLDINMPGMNGFEVLARLRAEPWARHTPIVALTANTTERDIQQGIAAGFNDYLTKPLDVPHFIDLVDECINPLKP